MTLLARMGPWLATHSNQKTSNNAGLIFLLVFLLLCWLLLLGLTVWIALSLFTASFGPAFPSFHMGTGAAHLLHRFTGIANLPGGPPGKRFCSNLLVVIGRGVPP